MKPTQLSMKPLADHGAITNDHSSHKRIRANPPSPKLRQLQCALKVSPIRGS
jgi:hypothetical protein